MLLLSKLWVLPPPPPPIMCFSKCSATLTLGGGGGGGGGGRGMCPFPGKVQKPQVNQEEVLFIAKGRLKAENCPRVMYIEGKK